MSHVLTRTFAILYEVQAMPESGAVAALIWQNAKRQLHVSTRRQ